MMQYYDTHLNVNKTHMQLVGIKIHYRLSTNSVGIKINYRLSTNSYTINILSYTVLDDDISYEKLPIEVRGS